MNPRVLQCKNCWKWGHTTGACRIQGARCVRYNGFHKSEHHHHFSWCCKANNKTNAPRLEIKKSESCSHLFKCSNCKGDYKVDSNACPFWRHKFNREWYLKEYQKIYKGQKQSIYSAVNGNIT